MHEPGVDAGPGHHLVGPDAAAQGRLHLEDAFGRGHADSGQQLLVAQRIERGLRLVGVEPGPPLLEGTQRLLQRLAEGAADGHHLAHRLHPRAQPALGAGQLLEGPARHLGHHVVDGGLEGRGRRLGDVVGDLVEEVADGEAGRDLGDGEAGRLGGQCGRARHPGVHLDDDPPTRGRVHRELHVGAARLHPDPAEAGEGVVAHGLVLDVGQRLRRRDGDGVAGVHAHGVEVLDGADDDAVVRRVAHDLELELLPAGDRLLHQDLPDRAGRQALAGELAEVGGILGDARSLAAEDEARAHHDGEADLLGDLLGLGQRVGEARARHLEPDALHGRLELVAVLRGGDRLGTGPDDLDAVALECAPLHQLHGQVERGLPAEGGQQGVGPLLGDDGLEHFGVERLHVGAVRRAGVRHDGGRVRVGQDDPVALLLQHAAGLGTRVVELAGLADDDRPRPDDEDGRQVVAAWHRCSLPALSAPRPGRPGQASDG